MLGACGDVFEYVGVNKLKEKFGESKTVKLTATKQLLEQFYQRQVIYLSAVCFANTPFLECH